MIIHFIASKSNLDENYHNLKTITNVIASLGHELARDWIDDEYRFNESGKKHESVDWKDVNTKNTEALSKADLVIAEATAKSFSTGFQVANAIQQKKPVLILTRNNELVGTFGSGIESDFVQQKNYDIANVRDIISDFINENSIDSKDLRFNFFIDRQIHNYLRWASYSTGKNKSEILRELILREIDKQDYK
jgi:hypothetical protein